MIVAVGLASMEPECADEILAREADAGDLAFRITVAVAVAFLAGLSGGAEIRFRLFEQPGFHVPEMLLGEFDGAVEGDGGGNEGGNFPGWQLRDLAWVKFQDLFGSHGLRAGVNPMKGIHPRICAFG